jgi:S-adenosylmethionine:tRNA ribosyltransferase-isomerase
MTQEVMKTDLFDFELPADRIALRPATPRDTARLLVVQPGGAPELQDRTIADLPDLLQPGDCLVVNDSRVIAARLSGRRIGRGDSEPAIEATLHERLDGSRWRAFVKPAKKLAVGDVLRGQKESLFPGQLDAQVSEKDEGGEITLSFSFHGPILDQAIAERGDMPLPPYIASRREPDEKDRTDYQTLFAHEEGSVAAPTAGLHFTQGLVQRLKDCGIGLQTVTLHVGAGTFLPVKADDTSGHKSTRNLAPFRLRRRPRLARCGRWADGLWRSVRPLCACLRAPSARTVASGALLGRLQSSSRLDMNSARST